MDEILSHPPEQLSLILDNITDGITAQTPEGAILYANDAAALLCGFKTGKELQAAPAAEIISRFELLDEKGHPLDPEEFPGHVALRTGKTLETLVRFRVLATGKERWVRVKSSPVHKYGRIILAINIFRDITSQYLGEQEQQRSTRNQNFLVRSSEVLTSSLDYETILKNIAYLAVPEFADWCTVDLALPTGSCGG